MGSTWAQQKFKDLYLANYSSALLECEQRLEKIAAQPPGSLGSSSLETLSAGGKRLRPLLVFLCAGGRDRLTDAHYRSAVAVELVHMATLVHDDVLDGADLRRGAPTVYSRYGPLVSTAAGDFLFSSAFEVLGGAGDPGAISLLAQTSLKLSLGELVQRQQARDYRLTGAEYEDRCRLKTAGLFSASCSLGAYFSKMSPEAITALEEFGRCLGLAFQIADDILDFDGDTAGTGKRIGTDLKDGTVTLPLIFALKQDDSLLEMLKGDPQKLPVAAICDRVKATGAIDAAAAAADRYVQLAAASLDSLDGQIDTGPLRLIACMAAQRRA